MTNPLFAHTFATWLLANLIHPVIMFLVSLAMPGRFELFNGPEVMLLLIVVSILISIPCLVAGWLCLMIIVPAPHSTKLRFLVWIVTAPGIIAFQGLIMMLLENTTAPGILIGSIPAMISVSLAVIIRQPQFKQLIAQHEIN
jgi:hypothetical protein